MTEENKLADASAEMESMTPQDYLDLVSYIKRLEQNAPEAPASISFKGVSDKGWDFLFTLRDFDEEMLIERLKHYIVVLTEMNVSPKGEGSVKVVTQSGATKTAPFVDESKFTSPEAPDLTGEVETFEVDSVTRLIAGNGTEYLLVKGGIWTKYGWKAWPEVVPNDLAWGSWAIGAELPAQPELAVAYVDKTKKKIVAFARK